MVDLRDGRRRFVLNLWESEQHRQAGLEPWVLLGNNWSTHFSRAPSEPIGVGEGLATDLVSVDAPRRQN